MREAFAWFLGANRLGLPLYDFATGGCRDGMGVAEVNQNQGAESTICFLMSLLKMLELAGEGLERDDGSRQRRRARHDARLRITRTGIALARRTPRARQALSAGRRDAAARPVARAPADGADLGDSGSRGSSAERDRSCSASTGAIGISRDARAAVRGGRAPRPRSAPRCLPTRRLLIGAYFTHEYSVEAAALFNPSIVLAPDQSGLASGSLRFVMSLRAVGEGHMSSIEFRYGRARCRRRHHASTSPGRTRRRPADAARLLRQGAFRHEAARARRRQRAVVERA